MTCGIYTITSPSGRVYVGQSVNIERRFGEYRRISSSVLNQRRLAASFAKYGVDAHVFCIVQECAEEALRATERHFQETLHACGPKGLNCRLVGAADKVGRLSAETRQRMSEKQRGAGNPNFGKRGPETSTFGRKRTEVERAAIKAYQATRGRIVQQFDAAGTFLKEGRVREFAELGYSQGNISSCCTGRLKTHKGHIFKYKDAP